jgi:hypothetical protein
MRRKEEGMKESNLDSIKSKVRKLLALSKSSNENEAAAALEKANKLMEEHALGEKDVQLESERVKSNKRYVAWKAIVANAVSWLYGCHSYKDTGTGERVFTGESLDAFMAREMYSYLIKTIERCAEKNIHKNAKRKFRQSFRYGMASHIYDRIIQLGSACSWSPRRNEKIEDAQKYVERSVALCESKHKKTSLDPRAAARGSLHGDDVSLARQAGQSPTLMIQSQETRRGA